MTGGATGLPGHRPAPKAPAAASRCPMRFPRRRVCAAPGGWPIGGLGASDARRESPILARCASVFEVGPVA